MNPPTSQSARHAEGPRRRRWIETGVVVWAFRPVLPLQIRAFIFQVPRVYPRAQPALRNRPIPALPLSWCQSVRFAFGLYYVIVTVDRLSRRLSRVFYRQTRPQRGATHRFGGPNLPWFPYQASFRWVFMGSKVDLNPFPRETRAVDGQSGAVSLRNEGRRTRPVGRSSRPCRKLSTSPS